jgi:Escherichia/Staphylococcus phage prohead protease
VSPDLEHRSGLEIRTEGSRIVGRCIVFDCRSRDLGGFVEVVKPAAVDVSANIVALLNHDTSHVLGRTPVTLQLTKDACGVAFTLDPAPTQAGRDALALVARGDITGASFGFRTTEDKWHQDGEVLVRELLGIELAEISLTAFPAYAQTDVTIAQRSLRAANLRLYRDGTSKPVSWQRLQLRVR